MELAFSHEQGKRVKRIRKNGALCACNGRRVACEIQVDAAGTAAATEGQCEIYCATYLARLTAADAA
jgi:hypothetical protein